MEMVGTWEQTNFFGTNLDMQVVCRVTLTHTFPDSISIASNFLNNTRRSYCVLLNLVKWKIEHWQGFLWKENKRGRKHR